MMFEVTWLNYKDIRQPHDDTMNTHTIAKGNCNNMNREMAGKITSDVKGREEVTAAVAKELNATSNGMPLQSAIFQDYAVSENAAQISIETPTVTMPIFFNNLSSWLLRTSKILRIKLYSHAYNLILSRQVRAIKCCLA